MFSSQQLQLFASQSASDPFFFVRITEKPSQKSGHSPLGDHIVLPKAQRS